MMAGRAAINSIILWVNQMKEDENIENDVGKKATHQSKWGEKPEDNFGYASDEERKARRGLEDWEMVEHMPDSQREVPKWFWAVVVIVLLVAIGLSFPFWGDRPGYEREWINWGFGAAILYIAVFGTFVYVMVNFYSSKSSKESEEKNNSNDKDA